MQITVDHHKPLTDIQRKIYNMRHAKYPVETIATRMSLNRSSVTSHITCIRAKGWDI
jgi:uncharacterized protein YpbB